MQYCNSHSLAGTWRFALDDKDAGERAAWFESGLMDCIVLPGTTDLAGKAGIESAESRAEGIHPQLAGEVPEVTSHLTRRHPYNGVAWYQRDIEIPKCWSGKRIVFEMERTKNSSVWLGGVLLGRHDSLVGVHRYPFPAEVGQGIHRLTVRIDNRLGGLPANGHQVTENTQTNWNGIIGNVHLRVMGHIWIEHLSAYPDVATRSVTILVEIGNRTGSPTAVKLRIHVLVPGSDRQSLKQEVYFSGIRDGHQISHRLDLGTDAPLWDDRHPVLHQLHVELIAEGENQDAVSTRFGLREFSTQGGRFTINGRVIMLRGRHDACVFPLTGASPTDKPSWDRYFAICKEYGLNHVRFHTWCPPHAAFAAADEAGILLQPELANFGHNIARDAARRKFTSDEARRILREFGDSPSFVALALGNEMHRGKEARETLTRELRALDRRHLYTQASNPDFDVCEHNPDDDYWTTFRTRPGREGNVRGSYCHVDLPLGHIQTGPATTYHDYSAAIRGIPCPVIGHEVGQFQVFPDFSEISKYTGPLCPKNLIEYRNRLERIGLLAKAKDFQRASGALAVINYREEIEAALRTDGFGGFQLLDLQDFPGQGTALVGILDAFLDSKGLIAAEEWREFCGDQVVLAKFERYTWRVGETFTARLALANYGDSAVNGLLTFDIQDQSGHHLTRGVLPAHVPQGRVREAADLVVYTMPYCAHAQRLTLTVGLAGTTRRNRYSIWLFPKAESTYDSSVSVFRRFDANVSAELAKGGRVLYMPNTESWPDAGINGFFPTDFWCFSMFKKITDSKNLPSAPGTMGLLINNTHPALAGFPTEFHSDYQWYNIVQCSRSVILDRLSHDLDPIVQVIDNHARNHRLGLLFEAQVGPGRLLFCGSDLLAIHDFPEAACLLSILKRYVSSTAFTPSVSVDPSALAATLKPKPT